MSGEAALLWALARDAGLDGFRSSPTELAAAYAAGCKGSEPLACDVQSGEVSRDAAGRLDLTRLASRAAQWCQQNDDVSCLVEGMLLMRQPFVGYRTDRSLEDQRRARTAFAAACEGGLARGCTELGMTYLQETWSYASPAWAEVWFRKACDAGEPEACRQLGTLLGPQKAPERKALLEKAAGLGNVEAAADLARLADDRAALAAACDAGSSAACRATGRSGVACEKGDPDACLTQTLERAIADKRDRAELTESLESMCSSLERACREAEYLRDGSPVIASEPGHYASPGIIPRYLADLKDQLRLCHIRALKVDPEAHGVLDVWLRVALMGEVVGVYTPNPFDQGLAECADRVVRTLKLKPPLEGPLTAHVLLPFDAATQVTVREVDNSPEGGSLVLFADELNARGKEFDRCIVANEDPRFIREGVFRATLNRTGMLSGLEWTSADFEPEAKDCLTKVVEPPFRYPPMIPKRFEATLRFLEEFQVPTWKIIVEPPPPLVPDKLRLLALVPAGADVEGVAATAPADAAARVTAVHARLAELVAGFTRGGLVVETDVRQLPAKLTGPTLDVVSEELTKLRYEAFDVPDDVWSTLPVGRYDGVVLWVPIPEGRVAPVGTTTNATLRGAPFSALPLPTSADRSPRVETLLHAVWSQYAVRAEGRLGVFLHPADMVLEAEGMSYDNEFWTLDPYRKPTTSGYRMGNQTGDVMPFYTYLFRKQLHPAMRADLARLDRVDVVGQDDLALLSTPMREGGARNVEVLTDGRRSLNPPTGKAVFQDGSWLAADRPDDDLGWWGVSWASPVEVRRVVARFGEEPKGPATVSKVVLEGRTPEGWVTMSKEVTLSQAELTVVLPAVRALDAVRFRVLAKAGAQTPTCTELEVYATAK